MPKFIELNQSVANVGHGKQRKVYINFDLVCGIYEPFPGARAGLPHNAVIDSGGPEDSVICVLETPKMILELLAKAQ